MPRRTTTHDRQLAEAALVWENHERLLWNRALQWSASTGEPAEDLVSAAKERFFEEWFAHYDPSRAKWTTYLYRVSSNFYNRLRHKCHDNEPLENHPHLEASPDRCTSTLFLRKFERCSPTTLNVLAFILEYNEGCFVRGVHARRRFGMIRDLLLSCEYTEEELELAFREIRKVLRHGH